MRKYLITYIILLCSLWTWAQASGIPYSCGFEEDEDLSAWVLNPVTSATTDKWIVGNAVHSEGKRSLYISSDGDNPVYGYRPNVVAAYLRFKFPTSNTQQSYDLSFDWKCTGDTSKSKLYVMVCPESLLSDQSSNNPFYLNRIVSASKGIIPNAAMQVCESFGVPPVRYLGGSPDWLNESLTNEIAISGVNSQATFAIVFIWVNGNTDQDEKKTSICIDNVQIGSATIKKPQNLKVEPHCEDSTVIVSWESTQTKFEVQYRKVGSSTWRRADNLEEGVEGFTRTNGIYCSYVLQRIVEGTYDIRVKGVAGNLESIYVYHNMFLMYCPENHCVNFLDFDNPNVVCTYGYNPKYRQGATPYDNISFIDYGPDAIESRHTHHTDPTEIDPRTDGLLTVPPGALASVRLGNWDIHGEAESITYTFTVDSAHQGILIVRYAVVLQDPEHTRDEQPAFEVVVLDEHDNEVDASCGKAVFTATDASEAEWRITKGTEGTYEQVRWKDWTTFGVNLQPYNGQTIKVRFTTYDCSQSGHYGYAYFTLDCANAHIETENCGNDSRITCSAPDGFKYKWFNELGQLVSEEQELEVDASRQTYTCRVSFVEDTTCYFEVSTLSAPRFPVPEYTCQPVYGECMSKLKFTNTSHVMNKFEGFENHTNEPCSDCHWVFKRLSNGVTTETHNWSPIYTCPSEGDSIEVTYTCYIGAENSCDSVSVDTIVVPNIIPGNTEVHYTTCPESPIKFGNEWFNRDTTYIGQFKNFAGCDSISTLFLRVWPEVKDEYRHDSICSDQGVIINGVRYSEPLDNYLIMLKTMHGCDSALYLTLTVNERIKASVDSLSYACADDEQLYVTFDITAGVYDSLVIDFDTPLLRDTTIYAQVTEVTIPYSADVVPGHYSATFSFHQFCCGVYTETRNFDIRFSSSIVEQKWNDVLTLLSPSANGGYTFTAFQWYKDGQPLEGETHSYLYQPLDFASTYYVELTREDGVTVATCPIQPVHHDEQSKYPTIVPVGQQMPMYMEHSASVVYYTISGQLYRSFTLPQGYTSLQTPEEPGVYILKSTNSEGETQAQVMIAQ